jgi:exo-beta-1,3-glucanase (GH17 family)
MYDSDNAVLGAFEDTGIEIMVGINNADVQMLATGGLQAATQWLNTNIMPHYPWANIKYISVGNEILPDDQTNAPFLLPAMQNIYSAIFAAKLQDKIKVSTAHKLSILGTSYPPSAGTFASQISDTMKTILFFLSVTDSPLLINVYLYFSYVADRKDISLDYALFNPTNPVVDGDLTYKNLFDAMVDAVLSAMEKSGYPNIGIVISESGWPSSGNDIATASLAGNYNNNFIQHVLSDAGTPKRPGKSIESFVFSMFNEDQKPGDITEQHFGLFYPDTEQPVYPVRFT